ncbi:MAG: ankyrin repeat domain-containing protein [Rhizobiaceae bacterium]
MPTIRLHWKLRRLCVAAASAAMLVAGISQVQAWTQMQTDLDQAIRSGSEAEVASLIKRADDLDAPVTPSGMSPLALAAVRGETGMVRQLIAAGADVEAADFRGATPISAAARSCYGTREIIDLLIDAGADLENRSGAGLTPLLVAIQEERYELAAHLIARGVDVNALNA